MLLSSPTATTSSYYVVMTSDDRNHRDLVFKRVYRFQRQNLVSIPNSFYVRIIVFSYPYRR